VEFGVTCECGQTGTVSQGAAGTSVSCPCGRTVPVPSLRELQRLAGVERAQPSPELVVEVMLAKRQLPQERHCVLCEEATDGILCCTAECEKAYVEGGPSWRSQALGFFILSLISLVFGWIWLIILGRDKVEREQGKDRIYVLPLRICEECRRHLTQPEAIIAAMLRVPLYKQLLDKYPETTVSVQRRHWDKDDAPQSSA
jgi:hypothetical protein